MKTKGRYQINLTHHTKDTWTDMEKTNAQLVVTFFQHLMNDHDFDYVLKHYSKNDYTQHNRIIPNGITGLVGYVKRLVKRFPGYSYDVKRINVDGDYVILHSHTTMNEKHRGNEKKGFIITDTFKIKDGKISEHWDAIQPIDLSSRLFILFSGGQFNNSNPTF